ncbi:MAG: hypothetical protein ACI4X9_01205 [Kiritimatiellia bacterium]
MRNPVFNTSITSQTSTSFQTFESHRFPRESRRRYSLSRESEGLGVKVLTVLGLVATALATEYILAVFTIA